MPGKKSASYPEFAQQLNTHLNVQARTPTWLAGRLLVHHSTVSNWIHTEARPENHQIVAAIAEVLKLTPSERRHLFIAAGYGYQLINEVLEEDDQAIEKILEQLKAPSGEAHPRAKTEPGKFPVSEKYSQDVADSVIEFELPVENANSGIWAATIIAQLRQSGIQDKVVIRGIGIILLVAFVLLFLFNGRAIVQTLKNIFNRAVNTPEILEKTPVSQFTLTPGATDIAETATPTAPVTSATPDRSSTPRSASTLAAATPAASSVIVASGTATQPVPTPFNVTHSEGQLTYPNIAFDDDGILHLAWKDSTPDNGPGPDILLRERQPDGSWSDSFTLTSDFDSLQSFLQFIKRPDGIVCLFWEGATNNADSLTLGLYQSCYLNETWTQAELIQNQPVTASFAPVFAPDGSLHFVYVVPPREVRVGGTNLADGAENVDSARMAIDQAGGYHVIWRRNGDPPGIEYRFSGDSGVSWSDPQTLSDAATEPATNLWLEADRQGFLHLFWTSKGRVLCYRRWTPESGWSDTETLSVDNDITSYNATLDDEGQFYMYWANKRYDVTYVQRKTDGSWTQPQVIASGGQSRPEPAMAVDADGIKHLFWRIRGETTDYFYAEIP